MQQGQTTDQGGSLEASIDAAKQGSRAAVGQLLAHFRSYLLAVANEEVSSELAAKLAPSDLVQETCYQAASDFERFTGTDERALAAWLRQILVNNVLDAERRFHGTLKRDLDREVSLDASLKGSGRSADPPCRGPSPSSIVIAAEAHAAMEDAIRRLPAETQRVIELRHFQDWTFEAIGKDIGKSAEAARKIWSRGVAWLSNELKKHERSGTS